MKRLLCSTTAMSMALWPLPSMPAYAQQLLDDGSVVAIDGTVLCAPTAEAVCNPDDFTAQARAVEAALAEQQRAAEEAAAAAAAQAQAEADAAAAAQAQAEADAAAAAQAQAEADAAAAAQAQAEADAAAAAQAQAEADAAAAVQAQADAAAAADASEAQRLADEAAAIEAQRLADEAAAVEAQRVADEAAAVEAQRLADEAAAEAQRLTEEAGQSEEAQAAADAAVAEAERLANEATAAAEAQRLADEVAAAEAQRVADEAAAAEAQRLADEAAAAAAATETATTEEVILAPEIPQVLELEVAPDGTEVVVAPDVPLEPTVLIDTTATPDVAPEAVETLGDLLAAPTITADPAVAPEVVAAPVAEAAAIPLAPDATPPAGAVAPVVLEQVLTETDTRSSAEEFATLAAPEPGRRRSGLSDLEKVGLVALGAIVVGAVLNNGNQVVDNTGDRVVVRSTSGQYYVYKDDDALLRRPGSNVRTETYGDGSTRTIVDRADGAQVVTIRDATGRVLRRATYDSQGREIVLIDDLVEEVRVDVTTLPAPTRGRVTISSSDGDAELKAALARLQAEELGRTFSLRQIREIPQVRALAATVEVNAITFDSGSAGITASEAAKLADLGGIINDLVALNPGEIFLIEGHTDAVGSASSNLTLSDRRAESVARALTEYFNVPPENLVVQGYGEGELLIPTTGDERANRRVAVKVITPLMRSAALQ